MSLSRLSIMLVVCSSFSMLLAVDNIDTLCGDGIPRFNGDGTAAQAASLKNPYGITLDPSGNLLIADRDNHRIRRVDSTTLIVTTIAGNGTPAFAGEGGLATAASLNAPSGVAMDSSGNIFIADTGNHRVRKITLATGNITTIAGTGVPGFSGEGLAAASAMLNAPQGVFVDSSDNVLIADTGNHRVRKIDAFTNVITTLAGTGTPGSAGDGLAAVGAQLNAPTAVVQDSGGNTFIADSMNHRVRKIDTLGNIGTYAGNGTPGFSGDNAAAGAASLNTPSGVALDTSNNLLVADSNNHRIRRIDSVTLQISTVAGTVAGFSGDGGDALAAALNSPQAVATGASGIYFIADQLNQRIRIVTPATVQPPAIVLQPPLPNPARTTVPVLFSAQGTSPRGPVALTWYFGDGSAPAMGANVSHAYTSEGSFTVVVVGSDGAASASKSVVVATLAPNSGADGIQNVSDQAFQKNSFTNPVDGTTLVIPGSNGGVLDYSASNANLSASVRAAVSTNFSIDDGFQVTSLTGRLADHRYQKPGIFISTALLVDPVSKKVLGRMRKTIAISHREVGMSPGVAQPNARNITGFNMKGKFSLPPEGGNAASRGGKLFTDGVTFSGRIELPGGLDISIPQDLSFSIGNVMDTVTVTPKGKATPGINGRITNLHMRYPGIGRKNHILPAGQFGLVSFKLSGPSLSGAGFDTDGVSARNLAATAREGTPIRIQVLATIAGQTYEEYVPVTFRLNTRSDFGAIAGRSSLP